jgi:hypothetical protein
MISSSIPLRVKRKLLVVASSVGEANGFAHLTSVLFEGHILLIAIPLAQCLVWVQTDHPLVLGVLLKKMSAPNLHMSLLRPPTIQILRAAGFHSARSAVIDTLTDIASRYLLLLATSAVDHATNSHADNPSPNLDDVVQALQDAGALRPQMSGTEEGKREEEDMRGLESFLAWFSGPSNREIRRVAGFLPSEGDVVDVDSLEKEDYLTGLYYVLSFVDTSLTRFCFPDASIEEETQQDGRRIKISGYRPG